MSVEDRLEILLSLVQNFDIFVWSSYQVLGVNLAFIMDKLNVDLLVLPKKQRLRRSTKPRVVAMKEEIEKLKGWGPLQKSFSLNS